MNPGQPASQPAGQPATARGGNRTNFRKRCSHAAQSENQIGLIGSVRGHTAAAVRTRNTCIAHMRLALDPLANTYTRIVVNAYAQQP